MDNRVVWVRFENSFRITSPMAVKASDVERLRKRAAEAGIRILVCDAG